MKTIFRYCLLVTVAFLTVSCSQKVTVPVTHTTCKLNLQAFVRQGSNTNLNFTGQVLVGQDSVTILESNVLNGGSYTISLETNGSSVQFIIYTDQGNIFGTGMMENGQQACSGIGGGVLSGPAFGDMGDWRGEWRKETFTTMEERTRATPISPLWICLGALLAVVIFIASLFIRVLTPYKPKGGSKAGVSEKSKISTETVKRVDRNKKPSPQGKEQPLAEYQVTYSANDQLFDLSFEINKSSRYAGDFGVLVAKTLDTKQSLATALEIWLFDARNAQTTSLILMSEFCNNNPALLSELERKGRAELIRTGAVETLNTKDIALKIQVLQVEYETNANNVNSVFKKVALKIGAWNNSNWAS